MVLPGILLKKVILPTCIKRIITIVFLFATLPLYAGLFVECYPQWLANDTATKELPKLPILYNITQYLLHVLNLAEYVAS